MWETSGNVTAQQRAPLVIIFLTKKNLEHCFNIELN